MDIFGDTDPRKMPVYLFWNAFFLDYSTAIRANIGAQDFSVCPRHWYVDAHFRCRDCTSNFVWSAEEQKTWFEVFRFYVDSRPTLCRDCRAKRRDAVELRQEYDATVSQARSGGSEAQKQRIVEILDELEIYWGAIPERMRETRELFRKQLSRHEPNER